MNTGCQAELRLSINPGLVLHPVKWVVEHAQASPATVCTDAAAGLWDLVLSGPQYSPCAKPGTHSYVCRPHFPAKVSPSRGHI